MNEKTKTNKILNFKNDHSSQRWESKINELLAVHDTRIISCHSLNHQSSGTQQNKLQ
jgi:hypothetical protein